MSRILLTVIAVTALATRIVAAQDSSDAALERRLLEMAERLEALESDNRALRDKVVDLQAKTGENWLDETRAAEIRSLVQDVLADADGRASLQSSGMTAGWDNGFFLSSPDGRFRLEIDGLLQFRWVMNVREKQAPNDPTDKFRYGFENTRTRLTFRGHVFGPSLTYMIRGNFSRGGGGVGDTNPRLGEPRGGNFQLLDAWFRAELIEGWYLRAGQFKLPFNREKLVSPAYQLMVDRSLVNESLNIGYSQGIELEYRGDWLGWRLAYSDGGADNLGGGVAQIVGTTPANTPWNTPDLAEYAFTSRLEFLISGEWRQFQQMTSPPGDPFGLMVGVAGHYQRDEYGTTIASSDWLIGTADISAMFGGLSVFGSFTYSYSDGNFGIFDIFGAVAQVGFYVTPKLELTARYEYGTIDSKRNVVTPTDLSVMTVGFNWYIDGQDLKLSFDFGFGFEDVSGLWGVESLGWRPDGIDTRPQFVIRTQFQLLF
ncbi:MAG TPA: porin [Phycisphaerales bacterium]|nr:porin [Phycisphaerales bacterium]HMP38685.1 porin [Phycisphaerales bacterium]